MVLLDDKLRMQLVNAFTEDNKLHIEVSGQHTCITNVHYNIVAMKESLLSLCWKALFRNYFKFELILEAPQKCKSHQRCGLPCLMLDGHVSEQSDQQLLRQTLTDLPALSRQFMLSWSDKILSR